MQVPIWITLLSSLASGLITFAISTWFYLRHEERRQKPEVFRSLMGNRHGLTEHPVQEVASMQRSGIEVLQSYDYPRFHVVSSSLLAAFMTAPFQWFLFRQLALNLFGYQIDEMIFLRKGEGSARGWNSDSHSLGLSF